MVNYMVKKMRAPDSAEVHAFIAEQALAVGSIPIWDRYSEISDSQYALALGPTNRLEYLYLQAVKSKGLAMTLALAGKRDPNFRVLSQVSGLTYEAVTHGNKELLSFLFNLGLKLQSSWQLTGAISANNNGSILELILEHNPFDITEDNLILAGNHSSVTSLEILHKRLPNPRPILEYLKVEKLWFRHGSLERARELGLKWSWQNILQGHVDEKWALPLRLPECLAYLIQNSEDSTVHVGTQLFLQLCPTATPFAVRAIAQLVRKRLLPIKEYLSELIMAHDLRPIFHWRREGGMIPYEAVYLRLLELLPLCPDFSPTQLMWFFEDAGVHVDSELLNNLFTKYSEEERKTLFKWA